MSEIIKYTATCFNVALIVGFILQFLNALKEIIAKLKILMKIIPIKNMGIGVFLFVSCVRHRKSMNSDSLKIKNLKVASSTI